MFDPGSPKRLSALRQNFKERLRRGQNTIQTHNVLAGCEKGIKLKLKRCVEMLKSDRRATSPHLCTFLDTPSAQQHSKFWNVVILFKLVTRSMHPGMSCPLQLQKQGLWILQFVRCLSLGKKEMLDSEYIQGYGYQGETENAEGYVKLNQKTLCASSLSSLQYSKNGWGYKVETCRHVEGDIEN